MWPFSKKKEAQLGDGLPRQTKEEHGYIVFPWVGPPLEFSSDVDLALAYLDALREGRPAIGFQDKDGNVVAVYPPNALCAVIRGTIPKKNDPEKK